MKVAVIITCFNRKEKTINCLAKLRMNDGIELVFIILDDNSSDGTWEALSGMKDKMILLRGDGNSYWAGGMRKALSYYLENEIDSEYVLLMNDDVDMYPHIIEKMIEFQKETENVIIGNCCDRFGRQTYGAIKLNSLLKKPMYFHQGIAASRENADTFNCNAVLIPAQAVKAVGNFDPIYTHNFADYDYGFMLRKNGYKLQGTPFYVGVCEDDSYEGTWIDISLKRKERLKLKESPKGLPQREWNHFLLKNLGILYFMRYAYSAKIKIIIGR